MRVTGGLFKGRRLAAPKSGRIRPALDQVKEAVFNILGDISGVKVLDLFAGTGSIGIEALSRGAKECVFVDESREAISIIRENLRRLGIEQNAIVFAKSASIAVRVLGRRGEQFDLIFIDPPYLKNLVNSTVEKIDEYKLLKQGGTIVIEHHPKEPVLKHKAFEISDRRKYGQTVVTFMR